MLRNGREGRDVSHVYMLPLACPPAIVVWSADTAMAVMGPDSTAFVPGPMMSFKFWL